MSLNHSSGVSFNRKIELEQLSFILQRMAWVRSQAPPPPPLSSETEPELEDDEEEEESILTDKLPNSEEDRDTPSQFAGENVVEEIANPIFSIDESDGEEEKTSSAFMTDGVSPNEFGFDQFPADIWQSESRTHNLFVQSSSSSSLSESKRVRCAWMWMVLDGLAIFIWFILFHLTLMIILNEVYCCCWEQGDGVSLKSDCAAPYLPSGVIPSFCPPSELCLDRYVIPGVRGIA